ncbi:hypothetical protein F3Y22_tig00111154pilonHSYRG00007 [Hibiscus syriacus]|uniref:Uncharacterized protein n=1 Tax=Hibiscus syriacus TaxID=106335 RepID=A0A6A2YXK8_HIBSY|nr:hypothetical protein F3Y22_tig00111154pilonHSYRG00007 [Hibiscus syriacus]
MAYIPPHKRHSKDSDRSTPTLESLAPRFNRNVQLRASKSNADRSGEFVYSNYAISRWFAVGLDDENHDTLAAHLKPASVRAETECEVSKDVKLSMVAKVGKILFQGSRSVNLESVDTKDIYYLRLSDSKQPASTISCKCMAHKYTSKEDRRWSGVSEANINCPYKESLVVGLRIMWVGVRGRSPAMLGAKFEVAKFDGQGNFGLWQTRVKDLLAQQGILKALRSTKPASMDEEDWEELQQRAAGTIRLCLADEVMYHVMHLSSPDEIWRKLESQFMSKSLTTKLYLKQRLYGLKMQDDHDLAQHVNVFNQIVSDLARLDVKIEDEDRAMILLCSLPPSYEHMVTTLTYGKETINVEEITAALLAHNQRKQNAGESSQADSLYVKGNRDRGRKPEKAGSGKRNSRSKSRDKKTIHCYKCKEAGHMKRDCPKLKKQTDEKRDGSSKSVNVVEDDNSDCSEGDMLSISTTQLTDAWILDSGCSYHITPNREWFSTYRPVNSGSVYLGDDRCCNIVGIGDVRIKMHDGSVRTLSGVRHIPDLKKNLISLGTLHKNGFIPKADEDRETIRIVKGALTVMKGKMTAGNIYRLLGSTVAGGVHSVESCDDTTKLWHMRLAHLSERGMAELHKRNLLHGVKSCKLDFCKYCVLGKQTKVRFKTAKHTTQGILDYVHSDKSEVFEKFKLWKAEVENQTGRKIKCLRSDNGTEYTDSQFLQFCKEHGIQRHFTVRKTPQQNGVAERMNRSLNERARCLRLNAGLPKHFWLRLLTWRVTLSTSPRASLAGKVAEEIWTGHDKGVKGFKFWDPVAKKVVISRDVVFDEQSMLQQKQDTTVVDFEQFPVEKPETSQPTSGGSTTDDLQDYSLARDRVRRTNIKPPNRLGFEDLVSFALTVSSDDPVTFHDAVTSQENDKWMAAMVEEMESLNHNRTWELVPLPEGKKPIGCKWVYKKKPAATEKEGEKFKARLVAKGFSQQKGVDYDEIFSPVEQIYMRQPEGFTQPGNEHLVCRLKKSLYGLKQSPRQWYKRFDSYMIKIGYNRCEYDCCVYVKSLDDGSFIFLLLYVDDMLIAAKNMDDVIGLKTLLSQEFDMKDLGAAKKILGMEICRDRDSRKLRLSQRGYVEKMLERFAMSSAKPVSTPLANHFKLSSEQCPKTDKEAEDMAKVPYSNAVGCLMYAMGTVGHGIVFGSQRDNPLVVGYVDSDYAGDLDNRRSTTGYVFTLGGGPICWKSIVQSIVALSTTEAEYMAAAEAAKEALWLTGLVKELGVQQGGVQLLCDNQSAIHLAKNQVYRARTKHIDVRFHKIRELVASGEVLFQKVHTDENAADMFTKPDIRQGGDLLGMAHKYTSKEDRRWSGVSEANINCPYKESLVVGLRIMWVELNPVRDMVIDISCLDMNLDLRLLMTHKRILTYMTEDEMQSIQNLIDSAVLDPEVKGGLRWPFGKASSGNRYNVVASEEVYLKLKGILSGLTEQDVEEVILDKLKDNLSLIWQHFMSFTTYVVSLSFSIKITSFKASGFPQTSKINIGEESNENYNVGVGNPILPTFISTQKTSLSDQAFYLLAFIACTASVAFTSMVIAAVPTLVALGRAAVSLSKLADTAREELLGTMEALRLSGMEISDLTLELSDLSQEIADGVNKSAKAVQAARAGIRQIGSLARQQTISIIQKRASLPVISLQPVVAGAARKTSHAVGQATKAIMNMINQGDLSSENDGDNSNDG